MESELSKWVEEQTRKTETFQEKQARIKKTAEKVNKAIGMDEYPSWTKTENNEQRSNYSKAHAEDQETM